MFVSPDGETEEVDENTMYWTQSRDRLVIFSPVHLGGSFRRIGSIVMVVDFCCCALRKDWWKVYLRYPTKEDFKRLQAEVMET